MKKFLILFLVCVLSSVLFAQVSYVPDNLPLLIPIAPNNFTVTVDGVADENCWDVAVSDTCRAYGNAQDSIDAHRSVGDCELNFKVISGNERMLYLFLEVTDDSVEAADTLWWFGDAIQIKLDHDADRATGFDQEIDWFLGDGDTLRPEIARQANFVDFAMQTTDKGFNVEIAAMLDSFEMKTDAVVDSQFTFNIQFDDYEGGTIAEGGTRQTRFKYFSNHQGWNHASNFINSAKFVSGPATSVETEAKPSFYYLLTNYPNPFNPQTTIQYAIEKPSQVTMDIFNLRGQHIKKLVNEFKQAGSYSIIWNAKDQPSGIYYCRIITENHMQTHKMLLLK